MFQTSALLNSFFKGRTCTSRNNQLLCL